MFLFFVASLACVFSRRRFDLAKAVLFWYTRGGAAVTEDASAGENGAEALGGLERGSHVDLPGALLAILLKQVVKTSYKWCIGSSSLAAIFIHY